jgi:8-oxo-dGTP pyrophosphatase MutT (NUDIX family)
MTRQTTAYLANIEQLFDYYLALYPQDGARLSVLAGQLREGDLQLNDRKNMIGHLTGSALVINDQDHCLLIYHRFLKRWLQPGGHLDQDEAPAAGALRELLEETGIIGVSGPVNFNPTLASTELNAVKQSPALIADCPIDIDSHAIPASSAKGEGEHLNHDFQYIFSVGQSGDIALDLGEVCDYKWVLLDELLTGEFGSRLRRVAEKIKAARMAVE